MLTQSCCKYFARDFFSRPRPLIAHARVHVVIIVSRCGRCPAQFNISANVQRWMAGDHDHDHDDGAIRARSKLASS